MKIKTVFTLFILFLTNAIFAQNKPEIHITYSKLLSTYDFVKQLSDNYPDNKYKQIFKKSTFNTDYYKDLITQLDTLKLHESYDFQGYPIGQKRPVMTTSLIQRNLINSKSILDFKKTTFGIIPNSELLPLSNIISEFELVYNQLVYLPNKDEFEKKMEALKSFVDKATLFLFFDKGLTFYNTKWDVSIPINIAIIPSIKENGFTATAFLNNAVSEVPLKFEHNDVLFSVLMHEIYHTIYDEQPLAFKQEIESWFKNNPSQNSQYAYLLLNEALATAIGNGYVYEQLNGTIDKEDWYFNKYINLMAKAIYPIVKEYLDNDKPMDKNFIDEYIDIYDKHFSAWINELDNLLTNRYIITDNPDDFNYFRKNYRYSSNYQSEVPLTQSSLERMKSTPITKIIIVSSNNENKLEMIKSTFEELKNWKISAQKEFVHTVNLEDKTRLIIINQLSSSIDELFNTNFKNKKLE